MDIVGQYKSVLVDLYGCVTDEQLELIIGALENLQDDAEEIKQGFVKGPVSLPHHWIAILRFLRFGVAMRMFFQKDYDSFVSSYQKLSVRNSSEDDEKQLLREIEGYLTELDGVITDLERTLLLILKQVRAAMIRQHGIEASDEIYRGRMVGESTQFLMPLLENWSKVCKSLVDLEKLHAPLNRVRNLIAPG